MKGTILISQSVQYRMRFLVVLSFLVILFGCGSKPANVATKKIVPVVTTTPATPETGKTPKMPVAPPVAPGVYEVTKPGTKGWKPALSNLESLGARMDEALRKNKPTMVETSSTFDDPEYGSMRATPTLKIENPETFNITSIVPLDEGDPRKLIGDGERRVVKINRGWKELKPFSSSKTIASSDAVKRWPLEFQTLMFSLYSDGADIWTPLLKGWQSGEDGYIASVEEQAFVVGGKRVSHYRIVARKEGAEHVETEVIVDKERLLPLTIRVQATRAGGKQFQAMWTGNWKFGGGFAPTDFVVPIPEEKS